ncbi:MAG: hypothetical protein IPN24_18375 [Betaproteobacteria bacterium]|nr:hypothetical protein [Betaproteobacteria bacterium]
MTMLTDAHKALVYEEIGVAVRHLDAENVPVIDAAAVVAEMHRQVPIPAEAADEVLYLADQYLRAIYGSPAPAPAAGVRLQ